MHEFLWFTTSWHPFWVIIGLLVCAAIAIFVGPAFGLLVLAVFLYNVTVWTTPVDWLPWLFTIAVIVGVIGFFLWVWTAGRSGSMVAWLGALVAFAIALILMNGHVLGLVDRVDVDADVDVPGIGTTELDDLQNDMDDLRGKNATRDNEFERRLTKLENEVPGRSQVVDSIREDLSELQGQVDTLQELVDDHIHERVGQSHYVDRK